VNITRSRRRTTDAETDHLLIGWSVLQDVVGVGGAILLLAALGAGQPLYLTILGLVVFGVLAAATAWLLPRVLAGMRSEPDLFLAVSVATGLAVAGAGALLTGMPLALAAFIAGVTISEGPVSSEARRRLLPFRDLFAIFFFVAIGTLIDPGALGRGLGWLAISVGLGQIGEFGFELATVAVARGVLPSEVYAALLAAVAVSIGASSILVRVIRPARATAPA